MIVSRANRKLKDIRRSKACKDDWALLEGPQLLGEALQAGTPIAFALATPAFLESEACEALVRSGLPTPDATQPGLLKELADTDSPQGIVALADLPRPGVEALPSVAQGAYVWAEAAQDPGNLGALARVAEAAGCTGLALSPGCVHPNHPRALRSAAGSLLRLPTVRNTTADGLRTHLDGQARWIGLTPRDGMHPSELPTQGPLVFAVGNEGAGLSAEALAICDETCSVPMADRVESLNAVVATAVVLFGRPGAPAA